MPEVRIPESIFSSLVEAHAPWDEFLNLPVDDEPDFIEVEVEDLDELDY